MAMKGRMDRKTGEQTCRMDAGLSQKFEMQTMKHLAGSCCSEWARRLFKYLSRQCNILAWLALLQPLLVFYVVALWQCLKMASLMSEVSCRFR